MKRRLLRTVLLAGLGIAVACLVAEAALQATDPTDYNRFENDALSGLLHYRPNISFDASGECFENTMHTNSLGFYAPEAPPAQKTPHEFRILLVGSSFAEGGSVPLDKTVAADLERSLNGDSTRRYDFEVIPLALPGNGTYLDILYYLRWGEALEPDLVIELQTDFEASRNAPDAAYVPQFDAQGSLVIATSSPQVSTSRLALLKNMLRNSKLVMNLYYRFLVLQSNAASPVVQEGSEAPVSISQAEWNIEQKLLIQFNLIVKQHGARFMVASWATEGAATSTVEALHDTLAGASQNRFAYVDLVPSIASQERESGVSAHWSCDNHWSDSGNVYAAIGIFDYLQAHPSLLIKP